MTTPNPMAQIDAYVDEALDLAAQLEMEARLRADPELARQVDAARQLRGALREHANYHATPDALRARLTARARDASSRNAMPAPRKGLAAGWADWASWRTVTASLGFAVLATVAVNLLWLQTSQEEQLSDDVVASHVRSTVGQHLVDVSSADHHMVKPFLSTRLGFSPPVDALAVPGSTFLGGRVDYLEGRTVAALVYKQGEHVVNSFVWPAGGTDSAPRYSSVRGFRTAHWRAKGMTHWVVSDVNAEEFDAVVRAVRALDSAG